MRIGFQLMAGVIALTMASPAAAYGDRYGYQGDDGYRQPSPCCAEPAPYEPYEYCCERRDAPPPVRRDYDCGCYGEVRLNDDFFAGSGGVGPAWIGGGGGGGGGFVIAGAGGGASAGASAAASASASARASVNVSIRFRGGYRPGKPGKPGKGGGCCH